MKSILVAGEINVDLVFGGCRRMPQPDTEILVESFDQVLGSSSIICAMELAKLGQAVTFVGRSGSDPYGNFCVNAMSQAGIDVAAIRQDVHLRTGVTVALATHDDRALVTFPGSIAALRASDVSPALFARARHLHVSAFYLQENLRPDLISLFASAHRAGLTTSLDTGSDPADRWDGITPELLHEVDVFLPNRREAFALSRADTIADALHAFSNDTTRTIIKCGADGAAALDRDGTVMTVASRAPEVVRDTTGAGDSFDAGFLAAWLEKLPLLECLRWGNACGSLSLRGAGGTERQPNLVEMKAWLEHAP